MSWHIPDSKHTASFVQRALDKISLKALEITNPDCPHSVLHALDFPIAMYSESSKQ